MPKVVYTASKGLVQESGSGFSVSGAQIQQASETLTNQLVDLVVAQAAAPAAQDDLWDGGYFLLYGAETEYVLYFTITGEPHIVPSVVKSSKAKNQSKVEVEIAAAATDADIATAIETAVEALSEFTAYRSTATLEIVGATPYAACDSAAAGTLSTELTGPTQTTTGSGSSTKALSLNTLVSIIQPCDANAAIAADDANVEAALAETGGGSPYTLADGTFVGQRKIILTPNAHVNGVDITINKLLDLTHDGIVATDTVTTAAAQTNFMNLIWSGESWIELATVNASITGHTA